MKKIFFIVTLCFIVLSIKSQNESAWYSNNAILSRNGIDGDEYSDEFLVKVNYNLKTISLKCGKETYAFAYSSSTTQNDDMIIFFLERNQMYERVGIHYREKGSFIMFLPEQKKIKTDISLMLNNAKILYTK